MICPGSARDQDVQLAVIVEVTPRDGSIGSPGQPGMDIGKGAITDIVPDLADGLGAIEFSPASQQYIQSAIVVVISPACGGKHLPRQARVYFSEWGTIGGVIPHLAGSSSECSVG